MSQSIGNPLRKIGEQVPPGTAAPNPVKANYSNLFGALARSVGRRPLHPQPTGQTRVRGPQAEQARNAAVRNSAGALPDFPVNATPRQKMDFVISLLKAHPEATRAELENKYSYTVGPEGKRKNGPLKFAGGGQGNVIFIVGTPLVVKQRLAGAEAKTYEFLNALKTFFAGGGKQENLPPILQKFTSAELQKMWENNGAIASAYPIPLKLDTQTNNAIVVMRNSCYSGDTLISNDLNDIKIGARIVSKHELKAHNNPAIKNWARKFITTKIIPFLKGTKSRGYEFVSQTSSGITRMRDGRNSESILSGKINKLTPAQKHSLNQQLIHLRQAHNALPMTLVGSSIMLALPHDRTTMPHLVMGDFAHAMFTSETRRADPGNRLLSTHTYDKYDRNFLDGLNNLIGLVDDQRRADKV